MSFESVLLNSSFLQLLAVALFCFSNTAAAPTFGDEFVHIKVHVPKIAAENAHHNIKQLELLATHHTQPFVPAPKVIHHYHHRRRKPFKKGAAHGKGHFYDGGLVESVLVSEVQSPGNAFEGNLDFLQHAEDLAQHISLAEEPIKPKKHLNTYTIVEETKKLPLKPSIETFKVIESKPLKAHVETFRVIEAPEEDPPHYAQHDNYHYHKPTHTETIKVLDDDYHYKPLKPLSNAVTVVEAHAPSPHYEDHTRHTYKLAKKKPIFDEHYKIVEHEHHYRPRPNTPSYTQPAYKSKSPTHYVVEEQNYSKERPGSDYHYERPEKYPQDAHDTEYSHAVESGYSSDGYSYTRPHQSSSSYLPPFEDEALAGVGHGISPGYMYESPTFEDHSSIRGAAETYSGIDSYNAAHVQGVDDDGGYHYPKPYA